MVRYYTRYIVMYTEKPFTSIVHDLPKILQPPSSISFHRCGSRSNTLFARCSTL